MGMWFQNKKSTGKVGNEQKNDKQTQKTSKKKKKIGKSSSLLWKERIIPHPDGIVHCDSLSNTPIFFREKKIEP